LDDRYPNSYHHLAGAGVAVMPDQNLIGRTVDETVESSVSAVSWPAILAGGLTAITATLILLMVGAGLGFSAVSPWTGHGVSGATLAVTTAIWLIVVQWLSAAVGGYVTGRLRTRWTSTHRDEVFFRDTAHGLLAWALATVIGAALLGSAVSGIVGAGVSTAGNAAQGAMAIAAAAVGPISQYDVDTLLRPAQSNAATKDANAPDIGPEVTRIITNGITAGDVSRPDRDYLAQVVTSRAGISPDEAKQRVDQGIEKAKQASVKAQQVADTARKTAAHTMLFGALAMLIGAFVASAAAAYGGWLRDEPA
jgi:hypothetical protein